MGIYSHSEQEFTHLIELTPALRDRIEGVIEGLIFILDMFDGDENTEEDDPLEPIGDDEPSLGWTDAQSFTEEYGEGDRHNCYLVYDRELDDSEIVACRAA